ncbi:single-stranded-DNA-specific exonuclease RecJ [Alteribacillus iranensis]|uniref:Single-stranded-DNA-specific exonuclease RecJ n=1 Tax=Alteribacillus iranensis TaxID=930128 RepID=A0A1I1Z6P6_9BACI|nr:single-stranded-DNA-specific exonuclease RecJ [Alteribacillus iranensis]SFE27379.1 exonuclease RecJ [Alteribacillus iranensis]
MLQSKTRWKMEEMSWDGWEMLQEELSLSTLTAKLLWKRGYREKMSAASFMQANMADIHDPFLMDGMDKAVQRIRDAVSNNEKILIFGDYDADGVSSTTIMIETLKELGADFGWYIPNRFTEGYGPNIPALQTAKDEGASLVITVDTGIAAVGEIEAANEMGLDVIITDHHEPPPELPKAFAVINPKKPGCPYPFKELAGAGVALKLSHALLEAFPEQLLDIFTIGTVSDLVPLLDENRSLVKEGLKKLAQSQRPGIRALKEICGITSEHIEEDHVGFSMGPRINAAGRMDSADPAVHLLLSDSTEEASEWAMLIDQLNKERQTVVNQITEEAIELVENVYPPEDNKFLIIAKEDWNPGVIGIAASRLVEKFYRPVIVLSIDKEKREAKGSARSIEGFNMFEELSKNRDLLPHFGGHPMAAGLTMNADDIEELRKRLLAQADDTLSETSLIPVTPIDAAIPLEEVSLQSLEELKQLAPFGVGHPKPVFLLEDVQVASKRKIGSEKNHLKAEWERNGKRLDCVGFYLGHIADQLTEQATASVVGELAVNEWNGFRKPQLFLKDLAIHEWQLFDKRQHKSIISYVKSLPSNDWALLTFKEKNHTHYKASLESDQVYLCDRVTGTVDAKDIILADLPSSMEELENALMSFTNMERVHAFFEEENQVYFQPLPSREDFKWYYAFLKKRGIFDITRQGEELARRRGWLPASISFMTKVFFELDFVKMKDGKVELTESPLKKDLAESRSYKTFEQKKLLEQELLFSTYNQLKNTLDSLIVNSGHNNDTKEKVGNGL